MASRGLNKLFLIGHVGRDPELRYLPSGKAVTSFSLAVGRVTGSGERRQEETEWFRVVAWDRLAETCSEFLRKGSRIYLEGRLQTRTYTDREGVERKAVEVVAGELLMLDGRPAATAEPPAAGSEAAPAVPAPDDTDIDDIPF